MYFSTTAGELWQNVTGGEFILSRYDPGSSVIGNITQLMGTNIINSFMLFSTSSGQIWRNSNGGSFTELTPLTGLQGTVTQMATDGLSTIIFLTSIDNQV